MDTRVITADHILEWHQQLQDAGETDVYFSPEYAGLFDEIDGGKAYLFVYKERDCLFLYPFRRRPLPQIEEFSEFSDWSDISSDYGYGGPLVKMPDEIPKAGFVSRAIEAFDDYCSEHRIVSEFCRFHPLLANAQIVEPQYAPILCNQTVWVDLTLSEEECWRKIRRNHRQDIRRAQEHGIEIETAHSVEAADTFYRLYAQTMRDVGAERYYFFSGTFFRETLQRLAEHVAIFLAWYEGKAIGGVLYIWGTRFSHAHFSAMDRRFTYFRPSKLAHYEAIVRSRNRGLRKLHLGGGVGGSDHDPLMHFKAGFSKLRAEFYVAKRIHDHAMYRKLCAKVDIDPDIEPYFPAYRTNNRQTDKGGQ